MVHNESLQNTIELQQSSAPPPAPKELEKPTAMEKPAPMQSAAPAAAKTEPTKQEPTGPKIHKLKRLPHANKRLLFSDGSEIIVPGAQPDLCHDADLISETGL